MRAEITLCPTCQHAAGGHNPDCSRARPAQGFAANSEARKRIRDAAFAPVAVRGEAVDAAVDELLAADPAPAQPDAALTDALADWLGAMPESRNVVWCDECEEWVTSGEPEGQPVPAPERDEAAVKGGDGRG